MNTIYFLSGILESPAVLASRAVAEGGLLAAKIGFGVMVLGIVMGLVQKLFGKKQVPTKDPAVEPVPAASPVAEASVDEIVPLPKSDAQPFLDRIAKGEPSCFMCLGTDSLLFQARLKSYSAYAATRNGALHILGTRKSVEGPFMLLRIGSREEHDRQGREGQTGGELDRISKAILTPEELAAFRPADAYSNYALPGCQLISLDGFNRCVSQLQSSEWSVVTVKLPDIAPPAQVAAAPEEKSSIDYAAINEALGGLMRRLRDKPERGLPFIVIEVQHHLGTQCVAWAEPDSPGFPVDRAEALVRECLAPLGVVVAGANHTCDSTGTHLILWFIREARK